MRYLHKFSSSITEVSQEYCPLFKSRPYLEGEPARKVLAERNYLRKRVDELESVFNFAQDEIKKLQERITQLEQKNGQIKESLTQAQQSPFKKLFSKKRNPDDAPRKRGAPFGHPGTSGKTPEKVDEIVAVPLDRCPDCGDPCLSICKQWDKYIQQDIIIKKVITRCFIRFHYWCPICKKVISGYAQNEIPKAPIGPKAKSVASFLRYEIKISYDDISRIFNNLFGLEIAPGAIVGFDNKVYQRGLPVYEGLKRLKKSSRMKILLSLSVRPSKG